MSRTTGASPAPSSRSRKRWALIAAGAIILVLIATALTAWRDARIDLRAYSPVFSTAPGSFACADGLVELLDGIDVEAEVSESSRGCSTSFKPGTGGAVGAWTYEVRVSRSEFDTDFGPYQELDSPWTGGECALFDRGFLGDSRYLSDNGGFCVIPETFPEFRISKAVKSKVLLARFGEQVEIDIEIRLDPEAEYVAADRTVPGSERAYLEHRAAAVYATQLDPTGAANTQLIEQIGSVNTPSKWTDETDDAWCSDAATVDLPGFMEGEVDWIRYAPSPPVSADTSRWTTGDIDELHCSTSWAVEVQNDDVPEQPRTMEGLATGLSVTPWPWGPDALQEGSGYLNGLADCAPLDLGEIEMDPSWPPEIAAALEEAQRCAVRDEESAVVFTLGDASLVRIWSYTWDSAGHVGSHPSWTIGTQSQLLTKVIERLAVSQG
ncbi:hypothetical protein O1R50_03435 [Glycomyces luteolus]|uniref:Uncharacterized protein n=1 Tax=Glycomyces luteolus TaxID=2670330 RepID=A0A9X3P830_9ACTN|nr:hypothetical protein [Glycomyces luteolus]MDA1358658.1 hypothetical protein [Glycomyces luteolus]